MARYPLDYGESYRPSSRRGFERSSRGRFSRQDLGYGREFRGSQRGYRSGEIGYGSEYMGHGLEYGAYGAYGSEYTGSGYGQEFRKSRWQTDYGDPFHDRERGTPIRLIRGEFDQYGEEYSSWGRGRSSGMQGYGSEFRGGYRGGYGSGYSREYRPRRRF